MLQTQKDKFVWLSPCSVVEINTLSDEGICCVDIFHTFKNPGYKWNDLSGTPRMQHVDSKD